MTKLDPKRYLERLESGLVPIAAAQPLVCSTCRSGANPGYERCYQCEHAGILKVLPISMSIHGEALHHRLRNYKDGDTQQKLEYTMQIAALLLLFFSSCTATASASADNSTELSQFRQVQVHEMLSGALSTDSLTFVTST